MLVVCTRDQHNTCLNPCLLHLLITDLEITYARSTSYAEFEVSSAGVSKDAEGPQAAPGGASLEMTGAAMTTQLVGGAPDSSNPFWIEEEEAAEARRQRSGPVAAPLPTTVASPRENGGHSNGLLDDGIPVAPGGRSLPAPGQNLVNMQLMGPATERAQDAEEGQAPPQGVVWGPLVFEARRFVELRKLSFFEQFKSSESFGMGCFYTLCVFTMQFYLGECEGWGVVVKSNGKRALDRRAAELHTPSSLVHSTPRA